MNRYEKIYKRLKHKKILLFSKRVFDFFIAFISIVLLQIPFLFIAAAIVIDSGFPVFYRQRRVGKNRRLFYIIKFRSMYVGSDASQENLTKANDDRVTRVGTFIRKFKLDELAQLYNVLIGHMSLVGPRPETPKYVQLYKEYPEVIFAVRPGITDRASVAFSNESQYYIEGVDSEKIYLEKILPKKIEMKLEYLENISFKEDIDIILATARQLLVVVGGGTDNKEVK